MSVIKIEDIAHVRFSAPDLDKMEAFLTEFGLDTSRFEDGRLYGRGHDDGAFVHSTEEGEPRFLGLGLRAQSIEDLERLASSEGLDIRDLVGPGGGKCISLTDPD
ncbi:MAG: glyoxalase, partial [Pseudomonadota bacterium]